jgi:hypothetical protein
MARSTESLPLNLGGGNRTRDWALNPYEPPAKTISRLNTTARVPAFVMEASLSRDFNWL